jgi:hypothetical protein
LREKAPAFRTGFRVSSDGAEREDAHGRPLFGERSCRVTGGERVEPFEGPGAIAIAKRRLRFGEEGGLISQAR